jgi:uncharacterized RDD family membrane protein YckC
MDPVTWAKAKGPAYVGLLAGATICVVLLMAIAVVGIVNPAHELIIEPSFFAVATIFLAVAAMEFDKSDNGSNST